jgi:hypothetical protein
MNFLPFTENQDNYTVHKSPPFIILSNPQILCLFFYDYFNIILPTMSIACTQSAFGAMEGDCRTESQHFGMGAPETNVKLYVANLAPKLFSQLF